MGWSEVMFRLLEAQNVKQSDSPTGLLQGPIEISIIEKKKRKILSLHTQKSEYKYKKKKGKIIIIKNYEYKALLIMKTRERRMGSVCH